MQIGLVGEALTHDAKGRRVLRVQRTKPLQTFNLRPHIRSPSTPLKTQCWQGHSTLCGGHAVGKAPGGDRHGPDHDFIKHGGKNAAVGHALETNVFGLRGEPGVNGASIGCESELKPMGVELTANEAGMRVRKRGHRSLAASGISAGWWVCKKTLSANQRITGDRVLHRRRKSEVCTFSRSNAGRRAMSPRLNAQPEELPAAK